MGLTHRVCCGYDISDVRFSVAFDVHAGKIGRDLSEAIWSRPNNALKFCDVPALGVVVREGILSDGIGESCREHIEARDGGTLAGVAEQLRATGTHVVVNFMPAGSQHASELYAEAAWLAGCAFVNCIPSYIARSADWARR